MGQALTGTEYEAGGTHHGTAPIWRMLGFGDTGNGILSANAVIQALRHRERTGEGQFVHTSILNASLLFNSYTYARPGRPAPTAGASTPSSTGSRRCSGCTRRRRLDLRLRPRRRGVGGAGRHGVAELAGDERFADARRGPTTPSSANCSTGVPGPRRRHWFDVLDAAGVPCEIASSTFARELFDDPDMHRRGWVIASDTSTSRRVEQVGMSFSFSATPAMNLAGSPVTGQHSRLLGSCAEIGLVADGSENRRAGGVHVPPRRRSGAAAERRQMNIDLSGKVAVVTGAAGASAEMVQAFAAAGADVVIASRKLDSCEELADDRREEPVAGARRCAHVGRWDDIDRLVDVVYGEFGRVDVLVNNAGMAPLYPRLSAVSEELFDKAIAVNLKGPFRLGALSASGCRPGAGGSIINISSIGAVRPTMTDLPYAAAKAGLNTLTVGFAVTFGPTVRSNGIMVGPFLTDISKAWDVDGFEEPAGATPCSASASRRRSSARPCTSRRTRELHDGLRAHGRRRRVGLVALVEDGAQHVLGEVAELLGDVLAGLHGHRGRAGRHARRVREVALVQEAVRAHLLDGRLDGVVLEPEAAVHLALEVLARQEVVLGVLLGHAAVLPLPVEVVEGERDPADAALDRHELVVRGSGGTRRR